MSRRGSNTAEFVFLGDSKDAERAMARLQDAATKTGNHAEQMGARWSKVGATMQRAAVPIAVAMGASAKAAIDFQSSFAGVRKTVDASEAEFAALAGSFRQMATEIPTSVNEINSIGEAAGQLGIAKENILGFTRTMADLGVTTNLTAEDAATAFARFANITQMPQDQFDKLGSTIVALGNNLATTEAEIAEFGLRLAGAGAQIGLTEAEILGLGGALSSVGINAEAGGTAISKIMIEMAKAVSEGGEQLEKLATTAGMSASQFATAFRDDPAAAIAAFIEGLGQVEAKGGDLFATLEALGITEQRMRDAMLRTAGAGDLVARSMGIANDAFAENNALTTEAEQRYGTMASQLEIAKNRLYDAAITIGQTVAPMVVTGADAVAGFATALASVPEPVTKTVTGLGALWIASAAVAKVGGEVLTSWGRMSAAFAASPTGIAAARNGVFAVGEAGAATTRRLNAATVGMRRFSAAARGLAGLINPATVAIGLATTAVVLYARKKAEAKQRVDEFVASLDEETGALTENTRATVLKQAADEGLLDRAERLGISAQTLVDALLDEGTALDDVTAALSRSGEGHVNWGGTAEGARSEAHQVLAELMRLRDVYAEETVAARRSAEQHAENEGRYLDLSHAISDGLDPALARLALAHQEATEAAEDGEPAVDEYGNAVEDTADAAEDAAEQLTSMQQAMKDANDEARAATDPLFALQRAVERADDAHKEYELALAGSEDATKTADEASWDLLDALLGVDAAARDAHGTTGDFSAVLDDLVASGRVTKEMADRLRGGVAELGGQIDRVAKPHEFSLTGKVNKVEVDSLATQLHDLVSGTHYVRVRALLSGSAVGNRSWTSGRGIQNADGNTFGMSAWAGGGRRENHQAQIARAGDMRLWAEPETGGEAYIPFAPSKRPRSIEIWKEVGRRLEVFNNGGVRPRGLTAAGFHDIPQLARITRGPSFGSAVEHAESIERMRTAIEAVTRALEEQEQASRRAELVEQRRLAETTEERQRASEALAEFDRDARLAAERRRIEERVAAAEANQRIKANLEEWAFEQLTAEQQLENIRRRREARREGTDEWLQLMRQERQLAEQIATDEERRLEERRQQEEELQAAVQERATATAEAEQRLGQQMAQQAAQHQQAVVEAHRSATEQIQQTVEARKQALTASLTDVPGDGPWGTDASTLAGNIRAQIDALTEWSSELERLKARGLNQGVVDALGLGDSPEALNQVKVLLDATDAELAQLNAAFLDRTKAIDQRIGAEQLQSETTLARDLTTIRRDLHLQVQQLERENAARVEEIRRAHFERVAAIEQEWLEAQQAYTEQLAAAGQRQGAALGQGMADALLGAVPQVTAARAALDAAAGGSPLVVDAGGGASAASAVGTNQVLSVLNAILAELRRHKGVYIDGQRAGDILAAGSMSLARGL